LRAVFTKIREAGLTLKPSKCEFANAEIDYLGHHIGQGKVQPRELKVEAIVNFARPENRKQVQAFLGLAGYYRKFVPHYAHLAANLSNLLKKNRKFEWDKAAEEAFWDIKSRLATRPILRSPDFNLPFCIAVDASDLAIGSVLFQVIDGYEHPVCFYSKKLNVHELKYSTIEKEALALVLSVRMFSVYFNSSPVVVYSDHKPLQFIKKMSNHNNKLLRWCLELEQYDLMVTHRPGKDNVLPDLLSRCVTKDKF
jgi:hypothetical protein